MAMIGRSVAAALTIGMLSTSCGQQGAGVRAVARSEYSDLSRCWFDAGGDLEAFLVVAGEGSRRVPWLVSSTCVPRDEGLSYDQSRLITLGPPYFADPQGLLRKHVTPLMVPDNRVTHLPFPDLHSPVYYIVGRLEPRQDSSNDHELTALHVVARTPATFGTLLEFGPEKQERLLRQARKEAR